ncbi:class I SAM-dependent methyltransferase [Nocardioides sp.]|uniref:class I SAM-dependent methyltransferase n=1 Tax=Nocardioides sp. TaxID=35761 RepID=UPI00261CD2C4|nr:class I SAM-dependent methyltransferase [Nocardioides sp.]
MTEATHGTPNEAIDEATRFWEDKYGEKAQIWSGKVNQAVSVTLDGIAPGTALDLGCGEGGDSVWLARHGWTVTGVDLSATAIARARAEAERLGFAIDFRTVDLAQWQPETAYDLVSAAFLHSPVAFGRTAALQRAAAAVAPGGHLLVVGHAAPPPWSTFHQHDHTHEADPDQELIGAAEQVRRLDLDPTQWEILVAEDRARGVHDAEGNPAVLEDAVVLARRR